MPDRGSGRFLKKATQNFDYSGTVVLRQAGPKLIKFFAAFCSQKVAFSFACLRGVVARETTNHKNPEENQK
jgi:hypothetical protein